MNSTTAVDLYDLICWHSYREDTWSKGICVRGVQQGNEVMTTCQAGALQTTRAWHLTTLSCVCSQLSSRAVWEAESGNRYFPASWVGLVI